MGKWSNFKVGVGEQVDRFFMVPKAAWTGAVGTKRAAWDLPNGVINLTKKSARNIFSTRGAIVIGAMGAVIAAAAGLINRSSIKNAERAQEQEAAYWQSAIDARDAQQTVSASAVVDPELQANRRANKAALVEVSEQAGKTSPLTYHDENPNYWRGQAKGTPPIPGQQTT